MRRILLVIDDFNELVGLETLFRRLGFDVLSLGRDTTVVETVLGFRPDLTMATVRGRHVDGLRLAPKLRVGGTTSGRSKLIIIIPQGMALTNREVEAGEVDAVLETPFDPRVALKAVCRLLSLPAGPILEKYTKIVGARLFDPEELRIVKHQQAQDPSIHVTSQVQEIEPPVVPAMSGAFSESSPPPSIPPITAREERYKKFLAQEMQDELPPMANATTMRDAQKQLSADSASEAEKLQKIEREKREFLRAMMSEAQEAIKKKTES